MWSFAELAEPAVDGQVYQPLTPPELIYVSLVPACRIITLRLKEMYQMITLGGDAELELVDRLGCTEGRSYLVLVLSC